MSSHTLQNTSQKTGVFVFVIIFHILVIYGLSLGLNRDPMELLKSVIDARIIEEEILPDEEAPPPPPPDYVPPPPDFVPPPDIAFVADVAPVNTQAITVSNKPIEVKINPAHTPVRGLSRPPYPPASLRLGEEGVVGLALYLGVDGRVKEGKVEASSGFERLDTAALNHAIRAWKFEPCVQGDNPVPCWHRMKFRFLITEN